MLCKVCKRSMGSRRLGPTQSAQSQGFGKSKPGKSTTGI